MRSTSTLNDKLDRLERAARRFRDMVARIPDPSVTVPATPAWSVADVYAHVAAEVPRYRDDALGLGARVADAGDLAEHNVQFVSGLVTADLEAIGNQLERDIEELRTTLVAFGDDQPIVVFDGGAKAGADVLLGALLGEFLVHGDDIARAVRLEWKIDEGDVGPVVDALNAVLPAWVDERTARGHTATYEVRLGQRRHVYRFRDGDLVVDPDDVGPVDVRIKMAPVPGLLALYKRRSPLHLTVRGHLAVWGRKPWLAASFERRFHAP